MTQLKLVRRIAARPEIVFDAMTTPEGMTHWWGPDAGPVLIAESDIRVGGRFRVQFRMLDGTEHESYGEYLEIVRPKRFVISWHWRGDEAENSESRIEVDLRSVAGGTELTFTHTQLPDEQTKKSHEEGWRGALDKLERYCLV